MNEWKPVPNRIVYFRCAKKFRCINIDKECKLNYAQLIFLRINNILFFLQLIGNECYRLGQFYYAAKAFDMLEKYEPSTENWEGKRGACVGVFQLIIAGQEPRYVTLIILLCNCWTIPSYLMLVNTILS
jgi:hypothetical protein